MQSLFPPKEVWGSHLETRSLFFLFFPQHLHDSKFVYHLSNVWIPLIKSSSRTFVEYDMIPPLSFSVSEIIPVKSNIANVKPKFYLRTRKIPIKLKIVLTSCQEIGIEDIRYGVVTGMLAPLKFIHFLEILLVLLCCQGEWCWPELRVVSSVLRILFDVRVSIRFLFEKDACERRVISSPFVLSSLNVVFSFSGFIFYNFKINTCP